MSVAITLTKGALAEKIPDQILGSVVTWMRPCIGAAAAVATYTFFHGKFLNNIIDFSSGTSLTTILSLAFIAGFSERFVINIIEKISTEEEDKKRK